MAALPTLVQLSVWKARQRRMCGCRLTARALHKVAVPASGSKCCTTLQKTTLTLRPKLITSSVIAHSTGCCDLHRCFHHFWRPRLAAVGQSVTPSHLPPASHAIPLAPPMAAPTQGCTSPTYTHCTMDSSYYRSSRCCCVHPLHP